jgi:hypothetical protein
MIILKGKVSKVMPNGVAVVSVMNDTSMPDVLQVRDGRLWAGQHVEIELRPLKTMSAGAGFSASV